MNTTTQTKLSQDKSMAQAFNLQRSSQQRIANTSASQRIRKLKNLHKAILANKQPIRDALFKDYKKHPSEVDLTEIYPVTGEIKHANVDLIINHTRAGGTCINHSAIHFFNNNLPFGGVNNSGIGKGHGEFGFKAFSNARGILKQWSPVSAIEMMMPPYTSMKQKLIDLSIKYF